MNGLRKLQQDFTACLTDGSNALIDRIVDQGKVDRNTRLNIYQNAYHVRLRDCIETDHSILGLYLGDELFDQMVAGYIVQYPSHYPSLRRFGDRLPDYLAATEPFCDHPIIAEIAVFERKLMDAFDAADGEPVDASVLQTLPAEDWPGMTLVFHPAVHVLTTQWNSVESWQALKGDTAPPEALEQPGYWLIWRDRERLTQYRSIGNDGYVLYRCFKDGYSLATACELLTEHLSENQIGPAAVNHLQNWVEQGLVTSLNTHELF